MFFKNLFNCVLLIVSIAIFEVVNRATSECVVNKYEDVKTSLETCDNIVIDSITVPAGEELTLNIRDGSTVTFRGNTSFEQEYWHGPLIKIAGSNFALNGEEGHVLEGNGPLYWDGLGTWGNTTKPRFMKINAVNATMDNLHLHNCPVACVTIRGSENLTIKNWLLDSMAGDENIAPHNKAGHNTDGFTVAVTNNFLIEDTKVFNQDDCIAISSGENITVRNVYCHGSHGLTINGLGEVLKNVLITNSEINNAENGIHIKTHVGSSEGLLQNITYKDINITNSKYYGVNIQQNYVNLPPGEPMNGPPENNVTIRNLNFINVYGHVQEGAIPIYVLCAEDGCFDWKWEGVDILGTQPDNCTGYTPEGYSC